MTREAQLEKALDWMIRAYYALPDAVKTGSMDAEQIEANTLAFSMLLESNGAREVRKHLSVGPKVKRLAYLEITRQNLGRLGLQAITRLEKL